MKKIICAFTGLFVSMVAFADVGGIGSGGVMYTTGASPELYIPNAWMRDALIQCKGKPGVDTDAMWNTYNELAQTEKFVETVSGRNRTQEVVEDAKNPLTTSDLNTICLAGGIKDKVTCGDCIVNPIYERAKRLRFANVCTGDGVGGTKHCVDGVFVKDYTHNGSLHVTTNEFAQDVSVHGFAALGFAIEYARLYGHNVICNTDIQNDWVLCTTPDNQHFYTFKFAGTSNTRDRTITENLVRGMCAMYDAEYVDKGFDSITSDGAWGLDININDNYGCEIDQKTCLTSSASKFGLSNHFEKKKIGGNYTDFCAMARIENHGAGSVNTYPGYEYMTYAFKEVQTQFRPFLVDTLKQYVKAQGIAVSSFECAYAPQKYSDPNPILGDAFDGSDDDLVACKLNGTPVDFIFDDLFESKSTALKIGEDAEMCLMMPRENGRTASFDGKNCIGPTQELCTELGKHIGGRGTRWDDGTGLCVIRDAARMRNWNRALTIGGCTVLVVGTTALTRGVSAKAAIIGLGACAVPDLAIAGLERLDAKAEHKAVKDLISDIKKCDISPTQSVCSLKQSDCATDVAAQALALFQFADRLSDDDLKIVDEAITYAAPCIMPNGKKKVMTESIHKASIFAEKHKWTTVAIAVVSIGSLFIGSGAFWSKLRGFKNIAKLLPEEAEFVTLAGSEKLKVFEISAKKAGKTVKVNRIDVSNVSNREENVAELLKALDARGIEYVDYSKLPKVDLDGLVGEKGLFSDQAKAAYNSILEQRIPDIIKNANPGLSASKLDQLIGEARIDFQEQVLGAVNGQLNDLRKYIDISDAWFGGLPDIKVEVPVGHIDVKNAGNVSSFGGKFESTLSPSDVGVMRPNWKKIAAGQAMGIMLIDMLGIGLWDIKFTDDNGNDTKKADDENNRNVEPTPHPVNTETNTTVKGINTLGDSSATGNESDLVEFPN